MTYAIQKGIGLLMVAFLVNTLNARIKAQTGPYLNNRYPLKEKPYMELPLGSIRAKGWLHEMLIRQKNGATGRLDELYPEVMGKRNGWLGGDGDQWERGPYWIDGLLPLAYILDDQELKNKVKPWVEWAIKSQKADGYFGPDKDYAPEAGLQRDNSHDWWPKMVMLKVLQQYYSATQDKRVITLFERYFNYQLKMLREKPLGHWTFWAEYRAADNLQAVYWLYNITGESSLLDLGKLLHKQGIQYTEMFEERKVLTSTAGIHCVNLAQGIKEPVVYYQQDPDPRYLNAVKQGFADIRHFNGQPQGMYGGDELLHGNNPTQGSELCSAVEMMYSLEKMLEITGDIGFADHLERIAFNALPTQITDDFMARQYFQQANQIHIQKRQYNFNINHGETDLVFGLLTGYPCCTSNMHQGWPKFTQNLWYATPGMGIAALVYAPSELKVLAGASKTEVTVSEDTFYPFDETVRFRIAMKEKSVTFPFHMRIPSWCTNAEIRINGQLWNGEKKAGTVAIINRGWSNGDSITLTLPMKVATSTWYENAVSVERGPLVYALDIPARWEKKLTGDGNRRFGEFYYEVHPQGAWNYGIPDFGEKDPATIFSVEKRSRTDRSFPWNSRNAPVTIRVKGKQIPNWQQYNGMAGPQPHSNIYGYTLSKDKPETQLTLIPYGCSTLRISEFPILSK
ncbi:beta-L-arabinofuranosidase domain-containing protein [Arcticibacter tournemirensis]|uniref:Glycoside hydrolase family 127 protein n=1 Tax=Arcticibacter tournemirensis TaxID=699437 RepID=A0A4Q0MBB4_9SPHI|nr:beta-L-arabinofuranosidase domain-containing protein [Arcticibacter tournemirensis]RXF70129.1 hypothetical protein EKH83_09615 [Arcticibacter tournemirensis]